MTWGTPTPPIQRLSSPVIDDRFEKILAWQTAIDSHLVRLDAQLEALEQHLVVTDSDIAAARQRVLDAQQFTQTQLASAIDRLHDQVVASQALVLTKQLQHSLAIRQSIDILRKHAWDDWQVNLRQRVGERLWQFWRWLNRPLWRPNAS